jgi:hypothetical protein
MDQKGGNGLLEEICMNQETTPFGREFLPPLKRAISFQFPVPKWIGRAWVQLMCFRNIRMFSKSSCWSCCGGSFCFGRTSRLIVSSVFASLLTLGDDTQPWVELFQALRIVYNGKRWQFDYWIHFCREFFWIFPCRINWLILPLDI